MTTKNEKIKNSSKETMEITGSEAMIRSLVAEGVDTIFGYPGGANLPIYDALPGYPIHHVLVRHEQGAAHMADGYARATGRVGVAMATSGPGATNLVTGIATAMISYICLEKCTTNPYRSRNRAQKVRNGNTNEG